MGKDKIISSVENVIRKYLPETDYEIFLFGSQARGNSTDTSDIDIAIRGPEKIPNDVFVRICEEKDEIPTLRNIDIVDLNGADESFKENVMEYAKRI